MPRPPGRGNGWPPTLSPVFRRRKPVAAPPSRGSCRKDGQVTRRRWKAAGDRRENRPGHSQIDRRAVAPRARVWQRQARAVLNRGQAETGKDLCGERSLWRQGSARGTMPSFCANAAGLRRAAHQTTPHTRPHSSRVIAIPLPCRQKSPTSTSSGGGGAAPDRPPGKCAPPCAELQSTRISATWGPLGPWPTRIWTVWPG